MKVSTGYQIWLLSKLVFSVVRGWVLIFDGVREEASDGIRFSEAQQKVSKTQVPKYGLLANIEILLQEQN